MLPKFGHTTQGQHTVVYLEQIYHYQSVDDIFQISHFGVGKLILTDLEADHVQIEQVQHAQYGYDIVARFKEIELVGVYSIKAQSHQSHQDHHAGPDYFFPIEKNS